MRPAKASRRPLERFHGTFRLGLSDLANLGLDPANLLLLKILVVFNVVVFNSVFALTFNGSMIPLRLYLSEYSAPLARIQITKFANPTFEPPSC